MNDPKIEQKKTQNNAMAKVINGNEACNWPILHKNVRNCYHFLKKYNTFHFTRNTKERGEIKQRSKINVFSSSRECDTVKLDSPAKKNLLTSVCVF